MLLVYTTTYRLDIRTVYNPDSNRSIPLFRLLLYPRDGLDDILDLILVLFRSPMLHLPVSFNLK